MQEPIIEREWSGTHEANVEIDYSLFNECIMSNNEPNSGMALSQEGTIVLEEREN